METELEKFAAHVKQQALKIMAIAQTYPERAVVLAGRLAEECEDLRGAKQMARERLDPDRFDLAALGTPEPNREADE